MKRAYRINHNTHLASYRAASPRAAAINEVAGFLHWTPASGKKQPRGGQAISDQIVQSCAFKRALSSFTFASSASCSLFCSFVNATSSTV